MSIDRPTARQFRMARASLGWSIDKVVEETELSYQTILNSEHDNHALRESTCQALRQRYEDAGLVFTNNDGVQRRADDIIEFVGDDSYLNLLDDVIGTFKKAKGEVLFFYSDERRSPPAVVEKLRELRAAGIAMRSLIRFNDGFYMGPRAEYRCLEERFFSPHDVAVVYSDRTAFVLSKEVPLRVRSIRSAVFADSQRRLFEFAWTNSRMPPEERETDDRY